jgi:hypothetical protein
MDQVREHGGLVGERVLDVFETPALCGGLFRAPCLSPCGSVHDPGSNGAKMNARKDGQVLEKLLEAALAGCGAIAEVGRPDLGEKVKQDPHFMVEPLDKFTPS